MKVNPAVVRFALAAALFSSIPLVRVFPIDIPKPEVFLSSTGGVMTGGVKELVYQKDKTLSELDWDLKPVYTFSLGESFVWNKQFSVSADFSAGFPGDAGSMTDSDFLNVNINGSSAKTQFSKSDAELDSLVDIGLSAAWIFELPVYGPGSPRHITVSPSAGFRYLSIQWTGKNGYKQYEDDPYNPSLPGGVYKDWTESTTKAALSGNVIAYRQEYFIPMLGIHAEIPVGPQFSVTPGCTGSPLVSCNDLDNHLLRNTNFYDYLSGGFMIEPSLTVTWIPTETLTVFADGKWTCMDKLRGTTRAVDLSSGTETWFSKSNGGGAAYSVWSFRLGVTKKLQ